MLFTLLPALAGMGAVWLVLPKNQITPILALWDACISVFAFVLISHVLNNILRYFRPSGGKEWNVAIWILLLCTGWILFTFWILTLTARNNETYEDLLIASLYLRFFISLVVLTCLALITWVRRQSESESRSEQRISEIRELSKETELNALRQQLQPHFLFNSLNSIQSLTSSDPRKAQKMVIQLSDFLRGTINKANDSKHTVEVEIEHSRLYLEIEKVRFGDRLNVDWKIEESSLTRKIPALILQPLLENAIKHGLYHTIGPVQIVINLECEEDMLVLEVSNPFDPAFVQASKGTGFGLSSLQRRLFLLHGSKGQLTTSQTENVFTVKLRIPTQ